jgi:hypothetical protein
LKGNARTSGERRRREAGNVFDDQIRVGIAVYFCVKKQEAEGIEDTARHLRYQSSAACKRRKASSVTRHGRHRTSRYANHNFRGKIVGLSKLGFHEPVKMTTSNPAILCYSIDNIRGKIVGFNELS